MNYQLAGLVALYVVVELVKFMWPRKIGFNEVDRHMLKNLYEHTSEQQEKILESLNDISHSQENIAKTLEKVVDKLTA